MTAGVVAVVDREVIRRMIINVAIVKGNCPGYYTKSYSLYKTINLFPYRSGSDSRSRSRSRSYSRNRRNRKSKLITP